jgi:hypothetical protein
MLIQAINTGLIFHFQESDSSKHVDYMTQVYDLVYIPQGFYIPRQLQSFLFGYYSTKTNNNDKYDVNNYHYYFNKLLKNKLYFNYKKAKLVDFTSVIEDVLQNGYYYTTFTKNGQLTGVVAFEGLDNKDIKLLCQPLHAELLNTIEVLIDTNKDLRLQNERVILSNEALVNEITSIKEAITNIATTIKTIPAVVGNPLNPALVTNLIVNPADTFENQANIYEDFMNNQDDDRDKNLIKLAETTSDIKGK